ADQHYDDYNINKKIDINEFPYTTDSDPSALDPSVLDQLLMSFSNDPLSIAGLGPST
ncbi:3530_t:CDS:2, partial [Racocetra fulgida]